MDRVKELISDAQIAQFREEGYLLTEPAFSEQQLGEVTAEFDRLWEEEIRKAEEAKYERMDLVRNRPFIGHVHERSPIVAEFVKAPIYLEACAKLIGPDADLYFNQAVLKPPERGHSFGWHQDSGYLATEPLEYITCWTAISRTFVENGCIWIIPGSHKRGLLPHEQKEDSIDAILEDEAGAIPVEMEPGQVAIFSSLMLHKSGPNISHEIRRGYVPQYHQPGVRSAQSGEVFGDQYPILRSGRRAN